MRCLLLVIYTHPFSKEALTLHLARSEGHERYFDCNSMHCRILVPSHQHLMAEAPKIAPNCTLMACLALFLIVSSQESEAPLEPPDCDSRKDWSKR